MNRIDLEKICKEVYGVGWQTKLAHALKLKSARSVRFWVAGDREIPHGVQWEIFDIAEKFYRDRLEKALRELEDFMLKKKQMI